MRISGSKGGRLPQLQRVGRLNVIMTVAKNGRFALGVQPIGVDQRIAGSRNDFHVLHSGALERIAHELRRSFDVGFVSGSVLTLGMRRNSFSSSRSRSWLCSTYVSIARDIGALKTIMANGPVAPTICLALVGVTFIALNAPATPGAVS